jgi:hypothetical protein
MRPALWLCIIGMAVACTRATPRAEQLAATNRSGFADTAFVRQACAAPDSVLRGERPCELLNQGLARPRRLP